MAGALKKNLFYNSLLSVSQFIFPLITFPYVTRILGPGGLGSVNFIDSFTQYFTMFAALGIPMYGIREVAKVKSEPDQLNKVFSEIISIHFLSTILFASIYLVIGFVIPKLSVHFDLVLIGIIAMLFNVIAASWVNQGLEQFSLVAIRAIVIRTVSIVLLFLLLRSDSSPAVYYAIMASGAVFVSIANAFVLPKYVRFSIKGLELKKHLKPLIIILSSSLAVSIYILMDTIILGFLKGDEAVGYYSTALRIVRIPFAIFGAISGVMIPQISNAFHKQKFDYIKSLVNKSFAFTCLTGIPISMGVFISAPFLVDSFAGNEFHEAIPALQILAPVILLVGLNNLFALQLLGPIGKDKLMFRSVFIGMIASLILNLILIPYFSYIGTAITNMLTECVVTFIAYLFVRKYLQFKLDIALFFKCLAAALVFIPIAIGIRAIGLNNIYQEIIVIVSCILYYSIFILFFLKNEYVETIKQEVFQKLHLRTA